jgi:multiple sugar transport system substrate-binding protein
MYLQWGAMVRQLGGSELQPDSDEAEKVLQFWVDWATTWGLGGPAYYTNQVDDFAAGAVAIGCGMGSWAKPLVEEAGIDYLVKPVPIWENAVSKNHFDTYAFFHMVNSHSAPEVQAAAWKLAYFLDSHPIDYMVNTGLLQPKKELADSQEFKDIPYMSLYLDEMSVSMYSPRVPRFIEVADALARARDRAVVDGMPVRQSLQMAQEEVDTIMAESQ